MLQNSASEAEVPRAQDEESMGNCCRRALWWSCYSLAWVVTLTLGIVAVERVFNHDGIHLLTWLNAFTRYVYLPAYACLAWAVWQRRWLLAIASCLVVSCHLYWMAPDFLRDRRFDLPATTIDSSQPSETIRIFFANVAGGNHEFDAMLNEIAEANPDVIVLVEYNWQWHKAFRVSSLIAAYKFGTGHMRPRDGSATVFSRIPLATSEVEWIEGRGIETSELHVGEQLLRIVGLHAPRPMHGRSYNYDGYWRAAMPKLKNMPGATVIVGDFNATEHSLVYQQLKDARYRSAHDDRGRGYATTWPNGKFLLPPIRIDQAMISPEIECVNIAEGVGKGSDHKPLVLDVRIRNQGLIQAIPTARSDS